MAVFVTDGEQRSTLAVTRALGHAGIPVTVGETCQPSLAGISRYCNRAVSYPSPLHEPERFADFLSQEMSRHNYRVLMPMTDVAMQIVAEMGDAMRPAVTPIPGAQQVRMAQDKWEVLRLAQRLGIGCPATYMSGDQCRIEDVAARLQYPVVIKPRSSQYMHQCKWTSGGVQYAHDARELLSRYREAEALAQQPMVQELIEGEGRGVFVLLWDGELKSAFCHRRLREKPPSGGVSVLRESIPLNQDMLEYSLMLLRAIGWQGVAMVEFKMDRRDGHAKLMEINGRFWGSLQLAVDAGINFPLMLYRLAVGEKVEPAFAYRTGIKTRWLLGDLDHLLIRLKRENGFAPQPNSRLRACLDFLKFYEKDMHYEVLKLHDPLPGWLEAKHYVQSLFGKEEWGAH
jgi:predicted ATP-grasp superfamily ATP-dependent carboligase